MRLRRLTRPRSPTEVRPRLDRTEISMAITAAEVKKLRDATGAGMMDAKKALTEADGDFDKAVDILRVSGAAKAAKRKSAYGADSSSA